ncbi:MAG: SDR family oxidoreductase, partial [Hyphomonadaceae bacterium]|nr:SDR family oxidoreductase [Hyphomonadaceae bacterium]
MVKHTRKQPASILITGASSGIGLATARLFHEKGWRVAATMRSPSDAPDWMNDERTVVLPLDVTDAGSVDGAVEAAIERFGAIDVLFNNAGFSLNGPIESLSEAQIYRQFDVNLFGQIRAMKAVLPHMRDRGDGLIVTTSSIGGLIGMPVSPLYIASKHAVEGLIESARFELKPFGVRLKLIEPGGINTEFSARSAAWGAHAAYDETIERARKMSVDILENAADPREVAKVVLRAVEDRSDRLRYLAKPGPYLMLYN